VENTGKPMHAARVILSPSGRSTDTDEAGQYEFTGVAAGNYDLLAQSPGLSADRKTVTLAGGATETADLLLRFSAVKESVTVTASGREEIVANALQPVTVLDLTQLPVRSAASLGDVLAGEAGIAKRSSGPGNTRPVIRGFDGNRVMVMQDGMSTGTLSFQSGDHGEPIDVNQLDRLEVVRGPATLLYGSSAVGGVINAISRHDVHLHPDAGVRGFLTGTGGSNNGLGGASGGFEFGAGKWQFRASGGGQRTGNYSSPIGEVLNSKGVMSQNSAGLGYYTDKAFSSFDYLYTQSEYGVPYDPEEEDPEIVHLLLHRHNFRFATGVRDAGGFDNITAKLNFSRYDHGELSDENVVNTAFKNNEFTYRLVFDQKKHGLLSGSFGFSGVHRDYTTEGEEAIAPPTKHNNFAAFALENFDFESRTRVQFGGRVEHNGYDPTGLEARSFTGFSGSAGVSQRLWDGGAVAVNYSHAYRAPALEELYNNGPHPGNQTFEIGNPDLRHETNNGIDVSLRHTSSRAKGELNFFYYHFTDFVYFAPTGEVEDGLPVADYAQGNSNFRGMEAKLDVALHPNLWLNLGMDAVHARLTEGDTPLPRIPPVRGTLGFEARYKGLSLKPEVVLSNAQRGVFDTETPTAGYATVNLQSSYSIPLAHQLHVLSVNFFNVGDTLYRNHLSFLKSFAPEMGRGVRMSYTIQVF
jgi:iron complex outermembrane receptor protein